MVWEGARRGRRWEGCVSPETSRPELKDCSAARPLCDLRQAVSLPQAALQSQPGVQKRKVGAEAEHWRWVGHHGTSLPWAINSTSQSLERPDPRDGHDNGNNATSRRGRHTRRS